MSTMQDLIDRIGEIQQAEMEAIAAAESTEALDEIRRRVLGKKGSLSQLMRGMGQIAADERPRVGQAANAAKSALQEAIERRDGELAREELNQAVEQETIDTTLPGIRPPVGSLHPLTRVMREIEDVFGTMGFEVELGPEIEDDFHNFEALNFPPDHPARDTQDTLFLDEDRLLRTHTSPVQVHAMRARKPPLAVIAPGKCYRADDPDATHSPMFHQIEGFMVDTNIRFSDLKGVIEVFVHRVFGPDVPFRFRPHFFPFTEPSAEVDIFFRRRHSEGHMVEEWLEIMGAGMIHPNVLRHCDIDPDKYTGFAFGMGIERIAMLKHDIHSMYSFFENDIRFLRQFR